MSNTITKTQLDTILKGVNDVIDNLTKKVDTLEKKLEVIAPAPREDKPAPKPKLVKAAVTIDGNKYKVKKAAWRTEGGDKVVAAEIIGNEDALRLQLDRHPQLFEPV